MDRLDGRFDLVFIDADKPAYPVYYEKALRLLADRGVIVLDNMLRGGSVLEPDSEDARAIADLNRHITADDRVTNVLLTVRDGLMVVRKKS
jgi:caffeoyl-CoA O-methyltransferase